MAKKSKDEEVSTKESSIVDRLKAKQRKFQESRGTEDENLDCKISHFCTTRNLVVDKVFGAGRPGNTPIGVPFGRVVELAGLPHSGKTTLAAHIAAEVQSQGGLVAIADVEDRIDLDYWAKLGVDIDNTIPLKSRNLEDVYNEQYAFIENCKEEGTDKPILMILDSLGALRTKKLFEDTDTEDAKKNFMDVAVRGMGREARLNSIGLSGINKLIASTKVCYLYTNHLYTKINAMAFEDPYVSYGGLKAQYWASVRLRLARAGNVTEEDEQGNKQVIGSKIKIQAIKNSLGPSMLTKYAYIMGDQGFSNDYSVWEISSASGGPIKKGAWSTWTTESGEEIKFQGFKGFQEKVIIHPSYQELVEYTKKNL